MPKEKGGLVWKNYYSGSSILKMYVGKGRDGKRLMDKKKIEQIWIQYDLIIHVFDDIDKEFWYARKLMTLLGNERWENLDKAI